MGTRYALIVANDSYQDPGLSKLRAPTQDARALESVLADPAIGGFAVRVVMNQPEARLRREVAAFFADRAHDDLLLAHFSCHGVKDDSGQLYFATSDTDLNSLDATAVPAEFVNRHMTRSRSRRVVLLLDCCYSGAFARGMLARGDQGVDLKERFEGRGRIVLTASSAMEYAFEEAELARSQGQPSIFTSALVRGLETGEADRDRDGRVSVDELYDYLFDEVRKLTPKQTPGRWNFEVQGDLMIARSPAVRPAPLPLELQQAIEHPIVRMRVAAVEELERLLRGGHAGLALAAREALEHLADDDSQRVRSSARSVLDADPGVVGQEPPPRPAGTPVAAEPATPPRQEVAVEPPPQAPDVPPRRAPVATPAQGRTSPSGPSRRGLATAVRTPQPSPSSRPGPRRALPARRLLLLASIGLAALTVWIWVATHGSAGLVPGQGFLATAPWRLEVKGSDCRVTVSPIEYQGAPRSASGSNYSLQMRMSGTFVIKELTSGCRAAVLDGTGGNAALPLEVRSRSNGAGGDSRPFESLVSTTVTAEGAGCATTTIYDSRSGNEERHIYGNDSSVVGKGEFYVHSDAGCTVSVTAS
jgi:hypothetical protein